VAVIRLPRRATAPAPSAETRYPRSDRGGEPAGETGLLLEPPDVPAYLLESGLIDAASILSGDLSLVDCSSRNRNYLVRHRRGRSWFLKQAADPSARKTLAREAAIYRMVAQTPALQPLRSRIPSLAHHDTARSILVLTASSRFQNVAELRAAGKRLPAAFGSAVGEVLAILHRETRTPSSEEKGTAFTLPLGTFWARSTYLPELEFLREMSVANLELMGMLQQQPDLVAHLSELDREWRHSCLVHGDLKSSNILASREPGSRGSVRIVDWELACYGDPLWDVGCILADVVAAWLGTAPISGVTPPEHIPSLTRYRLSREFPLVRAFWRTYTRCAGMVPRESADHLVRSIRFAAARLIQTAFEHSHALLRPSGFSICLLQISRNLLRQPHEAAAPLFGISLSGLDPAESGGTGGGTGDR
jgi:Ser/Thr protein kinase RdoA (MazF antagonist)